MKSLIVTVAGAATRFNQDTECPTLKCLYHEGDPNDCLLSQILKKSEELDEFIIVGGYLYDNLKSFIENNLKNYLSKIKLIYNPEFSTFGSGYSLILGIKSVSVKSNEIVFVEGDLSFDNEDYRNVLDSVKNVVTVNYDFITANKAVVLYENVKEHLKYIYDTGHKALEIRESFTAIYNSAQIWKFTDADKLRKVVDSLSEDQIKGTNLEIIQGYFGNLRKEEYDIIPIKKWFNCNTVFDFRKTKQNLIIS